MPRQTIATRPGRQGSTSIQPQTPSVLAAQEAAEERAAQAQAALPDMVPSSGLEDRPDGSKAPTEVTEEERQAILDMLDCSFRNCPELSDSERPKQYAPRNPYPVPHYYPQSPASIFDNPKIFSQFDVDTLFLIFYYQQGTYQQYLAARELKAQSWRFHKKYSTWFQRHEEPKQITDEYEQGTYVYFDYESGWCQRKKTEFTFQYQYLEDQELP
eukprot:Colp12_sorted_trinity150504_noHs@20089